MKNLVYSITICLLLVSCNSDNKKKSTTVLKKEDKKTIEYDLGDEMSTEGAGAKADYTDSKIKKCTINIYGEMGQIEIIYVFEQNQINVSQENITYVTEGELINREKWTSEKMSYVLDLNGLLISNNGNQEKIFNVFQEVKNAVPFLLFQKRHHPF